MALSCLDYLGFCTIFVSGLFRFLYYFLLFLVWLLVYRYFYLYELSMLRYIHGMQVKDGKLLDNVSQSVSSLSTKVFLIFYFLTFFIFVVFTVRHVMQTRYCDENSVRPSVCPSVTRVNCDKTVETSVQIYIQYESTFSLVF